MKIKKRTHILHLIVPVIVCAIVAVVVVAIVLVEVVINY